MAIASVSEYRIYLAHANQSELFKALLLKKQEKVQTEKGLYT
jgi:hypothetical protein